MNLEPNIADLLRQLRDDTTELVREEVVLAKTELKEKMAVTARNSVYLVIGGLIGSSALLILLMAFSYLLSQLMISRGMEIGTAGFLGFLIVALMAAIVAFLMVSKALKAFGNENLTPDRTVRSLREDKQWAQNKIS